MKVTAKVVKDINWKSFDAMRDAVKTMEVVKVGVPRGAGSEKDGTPMALVAAVHEFGAPSKNIPERPFLRNTIRNNKEKYIRLNRVNILKVLRQQISMEDALAQLGEVAKGDVQQFIASNNYQLKPKTIARKGSSRALIDTGNLRQSINWVLEAPGA